MGPGAPGLKRLLRYLRGVPWWARVPAVGTVILAICAANGIKA
jgi:hypothetical protein